MIEIEFPADVSRADQGLEIAHVRLNEAVRIDVIDAAEKVADAYSDDWDRLCGPGVRGVLCRFRS